MTDDARAELEAQVDRMHGHELKLVKLAAAVDQHWSGKLPGIGGRGDVQSFRGLYAVLYRNYSGLAHPTCRRLNHVVEDLGVDRRRVQLEPPYDGAGPYVIATVIFGLAPYVTGSTLGWPQASQIDAIFQRHR